MSDLDERFRAAVLNFAAGKTYAERMHTIAAILNGFGNLEAAGDNPRAARVLFDAAQQLERLAAAARTGPLPDMFGAKLIWQRPEDGDS